MRKPRFKHRRIMFILIGFIVALALSYTTLPQQPPGAKRLTLVTPPTIHPNIAAEVTVAAFNDLMQVDVSRGDLDEVSLSPGSHARLAVEETQPEWTSIVTLRLVEGKATLIILGGRYETVVLTARWVDSESPHNPTPPQRPLT